MACAPFPLMVVEWNPQTVKQPARASPLDVVLDTGIYVGSMYNARGSLPLRSQMAPAHHAIGQARPTVLTDDFTIGT